MRIAKYTRDDLVADEREGAFRADAHLASGDQIMVSVTAQINIEGQDAWVKYGAVSAIQPGETAQAADNRVIEHVTNQVIVVAEETARKIMER